MNARRLLTLTAMAAAGVAGYFFRDRSHLTKFLKPAPPATPGGLAPDLFADSRNRMPLVTRDELNDLGKRLYDEAVNDSRSIVGLRGPGGIRLRSPELTELSRPVNRWLRYDAGLDRRLAELAILASARETDQHFEWFAHEGVALKEGADPAVIDVIRYRKPLAGLRLFGAEELIKYVTLMGEYAATGFLLHVFAQQLPDGQVSKLPPL
jgi:4-carboxymuconolactone decarboxylase